jgi:hypothetical protein
MRPLRTHMLLLGLSSFAATPHAFALPEYPEALQKAADSPCLPHCNVCHRDDNAGSGTVDRPFGKSIESVGRLGGGGTGQVKAAVKRLQEAGTDSDGDGVSDTDELAQGDDPNYAGDGDLCGPQVGCSASRRTVLGSEAWAGLLGLLTTLTVARFQRRRSRTSKGSA